MASTTLTPSQQNLSRLGGIASQSQSQTALVIHRFRKHRMAVISLVVLLIMLLASFLAPWIAPFDKHRDNIEQRFLSPLSVDPDTGKIHWLGTDRLGRDQFTRILFGMRITLGVAIIANTLRVLLGLVIGTLAGYYRGVTDTIVTRVIEFVSLLPDFPILLILADILAKDPRLLPVPKFMLEALAVTLAVEVREARVIAAVIFVLVILGWTGAARLMRAQVLSIREHAFLEGSKALGANDLRLMFSHLVPNAFPPLIVAYTLGLSGALATETAFSFLGVGITQPTPTLGNTLSQASSDILLRPWLPLIPCIPVFMVCVAFNFIGDGLRDALDPRQKK